jgi:hypothetical protein
MNAFLRFGKTMAKGLWRMICGSAASATMIVAIWGFTTITAEDGYTAVANFIGAALVLALAVVFLYVLGGGKRNKGGFER